jgi:hypothetical protein
MIVSEIFAGRYVPAEKLTSDPARQLHGLLT